MDMLTCFETSAKRERKAYPFCSIGPQSLDHNDEVYLILNASERGLAGLEETF